MAKNEIVQYKSDLSKGEDSYKLALKKMKEKMPKSIESIEEYRQATDVLAFLGAQSKIIDNAYKYHAGPLKDQLAKVKADFGQYLMPLAELEVQVKSLMKPFIIAEQERKDKEQAKLERSAMKANKNDAMVSVPVVNEINTQRGKFGSSTARKVVKWRVKNESKVPDKYWVLDDIAIGKAISDGKDIPGIEKYFDVSIAKGRI